jgi:quinol-cytochrome oxidoreductase complex cytochrome b subunit
MSDDEEMSEDKRLPVAPWDGHLREGPGAATTAVPVEVPHETGPSLEPEYKRMPIGPDHILYPVLVGLTALYLPWGEPGHHLAEDLPDEETHPFFPDHFWPYPIIMVMLLVGVGLLSLLVQQNMQLEQSADPRAVVLPRPDWYFLWLFQMLKLGNELFFSLVVPPVIVIVLLLWPFIDSIGGGRLARRLRWATWPVPGRNVITGTGWVLFLGFIVMLTFWALSGVTIFNITGG